MLAGRLAVDQRHLGGQIRVVPAGAEAEQAEVAAAQWPERDGVAIRVRIVGQDAVRLVEEDRLTLDHRIDVVHQDRRPVDRDGERRRRAAAQAVALRIGEGVDRPGAEQRRIDRRAVVGHVGIRAVGRQRQRAVGAGEAAGAGDRQRIAVHIGIVGEDAAGGGSAHQDRVGVIGGDRCAVDRDGQGRACRQAVGIDFRIGEDIPRMLARRRGIDRARIVRRIDVGAVGRERERAVGPHAAAAGDRERAAEGVGVVGEDPRHRCRHGAALEHGRRVAGRDHAGDHRDGELHVREAATPVVDRIGEDVRQVPAARRQDRRRLVGRVDVAAVAGEREMPELARQDAGANHPQRIAVRVGVVLQDARSGRDRDGRARVDRRGVVHHLGRPVDVNAQRRGRGRARGVLRREGEDVDRMAALDGIERRRLGAGLVGLVF